MLKLRTLQFLLRLRLNVVYLGVSCLQTQYPLKMVSCPHMQLSSGFLSVETVLVAKALSMAASVVQLVSPPARILHVGHRLLSHPLPHLINRSLRYED